MTAVPGICQSNIALNSYIPIVDSNLSICTRLYRYTYSDFMSSTPPRYSCYEHVASLDITMDDSKLVHMLQGHAELCHPVLHFAHRQLQIFPGASLPLDTTNLDLANFANLKICPLFLSHHWRDMYIKNPHCNSVSRSHPLIL